MLKYRAGIFIFILAMLTSLMCILVFHLPFWITAIPCIFYITYLAYGSATMSANVFVHSVCRGDASSGSIAITFDDGPVQGNTEQILAILKEYNIRATFFCIGSRLALYPELARKIVDEGHLIGNHSYYHGNLFSLQSTTGIENEIRKTGEEIVRHTGIRPRWFRPPYGVTNPMIARAIRRTGYRSIGWSVRSFDTVIKDRDALLDRVTKNIQPGDIVLFHENGPQTVAVFRSFLSRISAKGLKIASLEDIIHEKASY